MEHQSRQSMAEYVKKQARNAPKSMKMPERGIMYVQYERLEDIEYEAKNFQYNGASVVKNDRYDEIPDSLARELDR